MCQSAPWSTFSSPQLTLSFYMYFSKLLNVFLQDDTKICQSAPWSTFSSHPQLPSFFFSSIFCPDLFSAAGLYPPFLATAYTVYGLCGGGTKICINFNLGDNLTFWRSKVVQLRPFAICGAIYLITREDVSIWWAPRYEEDHTCGKS